MLKKWTDWIRQKWQEVKDAWNLFQWYEKNKKNINYWKKWWPF